MSGPMPNPCGTAATYNRGCRCEACRAANTERHRDYMQRRQVGGLKPVREAEHGRGLYLYVAHGCRCEPCRKAKSQSDTEYRASHRAELAAYRRRNLATARDRLRTRYAADVEYRARVNARNRAYGPRRLRRYVAGQEVNLATAPPTFRETVLLMGELRQAIKTRTGKGIT